MLHDDPFDQQLLANVHPADWQNPTPAERYDLVVIGAGTAGLVTAAGAAGVGARVALIERNELGGDCLNVGCVPSKALLRSAHALAEIRDAKRLGIQVSGEVTADFPAIMSRMREVRARISPTDSAQRFSGELGVDVFLGQASFGPDHSIRVADQSLSYRKAVIASGASPFVPPVPGIDQTGYLTNESIFDLRELPRRLVVLGGGPIGCELSQAFRRFGAQVTMIEMGDQFLAREDADAAEILLQEMRRDGVDVRLSTRLTRVEASAEGHRAVVERGGREESITFDEILIAVGRSPNVEGMALEVAGVEYDPQKGIYVDDFLRTRNKDIYAAGDVCMQYKFTHAADFAARAVIQNALFALGPIGKKKLSALNLPWCTYTDPEIAHVGLYERDAEAKGIEVDTYLKPFDDVDRAIAEGREHGFVKIHTEKGGDRILGATIVGHGAGDMISEITVAMDAGFGLGSLANVIHPYPTTAAAIAQAGGLYTRTRLTPSAQRALDTIRSIRRVID